MTDAPLTVVGLGKLGAPFAACLAMRGFSVIGIDRDTRPVEAINQGRAPVAEPGLQDCLDRGAGRLRATRDLGVVAQSAATFVLVSTAGSAEQPFGTDELRTACVEIGAALRGKRDYHLLVIGSTVLPGVTERELVPALEAASGKVCGRDLGICYAPEFVALGAVIDGFVRPAFAVIGESDQRAGAQLAQIFARLFETPAPIARTNFVTAEVSKLAFNTFCATKISFANFFARLCERLPGADAEVVSGALRHDPRIGAGFFRGGLSFGGPCLPRDVVGLEQLAEQLGLDAALPAAVGQVNDARAADLLQIVRRAATAACQRLGRPARVGVLGLSFKPGTDVTEGSPGLWLARTLAADGWSIVAHDPLARPPLDGVSPAASAAECIAAADVVVVATPWPEYRELPGPVWAGRTIVDCWRFVEAAAPSAREYVPLGLGLRPQDDWPATQRVRP
jgi:UDPglucose 6-dehydrogenase